MDNNNYLFPVLVYIVKSGTPYNKIDIKNGLGDFEVTSVLIVEIFIPSSLLTAIH